MKLTLESTTKVVQLDGCLLEDYLESRDVRNPRVADRLQDAGGKRRESKRPQDCRRRISSSIYLGRSLTRAFLDAEPFPASHALRGLLQVFDEIFASAKRKGHDGQGGGLIRAKWEDAGVAAIEVRDVMGAAEPVRDEPLGVVAHAAGAGLVQAEPRRVRPLGRSAVLINVAARRLLSG